MVSNQEFDLKRISSPFKKKKKKKQQNAHFFKISIYNFFLQQPVKHYTFNQWIRSAMVRLSQTSPAAFCPYIHTGCLLKASGPVNELRTLISTLTVHSELQAIRHNS